MNAIFISSFKLENKTKFFFYIYSYVKKNEMNSTFSLVIVHFCIFNTKKKN